MIHAWKGNASLSFNIRERREGKTLIVESRLEGRPGFQRCNNAGIFYQLNKGTQHFAMNIQQLHSGTLAQTSDETEKASVWFVVASQKLTVWSKEDCSGPRNGRITRGQLGWVCLPHHRRPAKSQGLWPQEVAAAPAGPHQARDYTTCRRSSRSKQLPFFQLRIYIPTQPSLQFDFRWGAPRTFSMLYHQASHLISLLPITIHMIMMSSLILMVCTHLCFQNKCRQRSISLKEEETQGEDYPYQADKGQAPLVCA